MFLYPLAVALILLTLFGRFFKDDRRVLRWTIGFTAAGAVFDFLRALPAGVKDALHLEALIQAASGVLPFSEQGFGWVCPALTGLLIGLAVHFVSEKKRK